jgi:glycine/D-amino acid oxidase-like deaminating enzyme
VTGPRIVVVGAGVVGAAVAFRLAEGGARVTVVDAGPPGAGTSGTSFAWVNAFDKPPREYHDLNVAGMEEHALLAEELGGSWLHRTGNLAWQETPEGRARLLATVSRLQRWGYELEVLAPEVARELEPELRPGAGTPWMLWMPREAYVDVAPMIGALLAAAARAGTRLVTGRRVIRLLCQGSRVGGVALDDDRRINADVVVNCAGAAAGELAGLAGAPLPVGGEPGRLVYTAPVATTLQRPVHAAGVQFRPDGGGRVVLSDEAHDLLLARAPDDGWTPHQSLAAAARYLPALAAARVEATRVGLRPMPRDRLPIVGSLPGLDGFYTVVSHSGVTLGPLWGRVAAAEILEGKEDPRLAPFRPSRFQLPLPHPGERAG